MFEYNPTQGECEAHPMLWRFGSLGFAKSLNNCHFPHRSSTLLSLFLSLSLLLSLQIASFQQSISPRLDIRCAIIATTGRLRDAIAYQAIRKLLFSHANETQTGSEETQRHRRALFWGAAAHRTETREKEMINGGAGNNDDRK